MMTVRGDGHVKGSISGGGIEDDLIWRVQSGDYRETLPRSLKYGISADEAHRFGLPFGGTLQIVLEYVTEKSQLQALAGIVLQQGLATRELLPDSGAVPLRLGADTPTLLFDGHRLPPHEPRHRLVISGAAQPVMWSGQKHIDTLYEDPSGGHANAWHTGIV